jgi:tripartite-type tricarboxylate transporter receptor subunit TctC
MRSALRRLAAVIAAAAALVGASSAHAQAYPAKPVRILVGYSAGGLPDTVARVTAQKLSDRWGQQVIVENRPSANGILAAELVAKAAPDGYTLLVTDSSTTAINPHMYAKLPYAAKDLAPVSLIARAPLFLAANDTISAKTLNEFIALVKAQPGKLSYGSSGIGSTHHLAMESMKASLGLFIVHIPYRGTGQSVPALIGGQVPVVFSAYPSLASYAKAGQVKLLAVNSLQRSKLAPDVPTIAEVAIPGFDFAPTIGALAPAGTPQAVVDKIAADVAQVVRMPEVAQQFENLGIEPVGGSAADYAAQLKADFDRYAGAVKRSGAKAE